MPQLNESTLSEAPFQLYTFRTQNWFGEKAFVIVLANPQSTAVPFIMCPRS
jgi:hypothetical protein